MDLKAGPSLPWNLSSLTLRNLSVLQETRYIKWSIYMMSSMMLCPFSGKVFSELDNNCIFEKRVRAGKPASFSSDVLY
jgi:hypothetical protein